MAFQSGKMPKEWGKKKVGGGASDLVAQSLMQRYTFLFFLRNCF